MNNRKKALLAVPLTAALVLGAGVFGACGKKENLEVKTDLATSVNSIVNTLTTKAYNNSVLAGTQDAKAYYTVAQLNEKLGEDAVTYYVEVGTLKNVKEVESIELGGRKFEKDQKVAVSIGNNAFVQDNVYNVVDSKLMVAVPVMAFETVKNTKIKVNDNEYALNLTPSNATFNFSKVVADGHEFTGEGNVYDVSLASRTSQLELHYEGATADDVLLTRKVTGGSVSYGLTKTDAVSESSALVFYPAYAKEADFEAFSYEYSVYTASKGVATVTLNISKVAE